MNETVLDRFLRYVAIDTQSSEESDTYPSTEKQLILLRLLADELTRLGLSDVTLDQWGYVMATLPGNIPKDSPEYGKTPVIGFIAHVDTSPSVSGANVKPQVIEYRGGDVILPGDPSIIITESENPELERNIGRTIVTSDGTTLLGADDKAGIAIIMTAIQELINNPRLLHGDIRIGFTPDEEVGAGTKYFDIQKFGAQFAYTVDGDTAGELNKETFSADSAIITVHGRNIHPGTRKGSWSILSALWRISSSACLKTLLRKLPKAMNPISTRTICRAKRRNQLSKSC